MKRCIIIAAVLAVACDDFPGEPQPLSQFYFPGEMVTTPSGDHLILMNTNFDQRFSGGTAMSLSVDVLHQAVATGSASAPQFTDEFPAGLVASSLVVDSFAGQPLYVPNFAGKDRLLIPSRFRDLLTLIDVENGILDCSVTTSSAAEEELPTVDESTSCPVQRRLSTQAPGPVSAAYAPLSADGTRGVVAVGHLGVQTTNNNTVFQRVELFELDTFVDRTEIALVRSGDELDEEIEALPDPRAGRSFLDFAGVTGTVFVPGPALGADIGTFLMVERTRTPELTLSGFRLRVDAELSQPDVRRDIVLNLSDGVQASQSRGLTLSPDQTRVYIALRFQETADSFNSGIAVVDVTQAEPVVLSVFEFGEEISKPTVYAQGDRRWLLVPDIRTESIWVLDARTDELTVVSEIKGRANRTYTKDNGTTETLQVKMLAAPADIEITSRGGRTLAFVSNFANATLAAIDLSSSDPREFAVIGRLGQSVNPDGDREAP